MGSIEEFSEAIKASGMVPPDDIRSGPFIRFPGVGKSNGNRAGWAILFTDGMGGAYGDWSTGLSESWQAKRETPMTEAQRKEFRRRVDEAIARAAAEKKKAHERAAIEARKIWNSAKPTPAYHPYLVKKGIKPKGTRLNGKILIVPICDDAGNLTSIQRIYPNGDKRFLKDGRIKGCYFSIGDKPDRILCIAEGFATAATIYEATGYPVAATLSGGNLETVARQMRREYPNAKLIICADDDETTEGNPGLRYAQKAADAVNGVLARPWNGPNKPSDLTDMNDLAAHSGIDMVKTTIDAATTGVRALRNGLFDEEEAAEVTNAIANKSSNAMPAVRLLSAADIQPSPIRWVWSGWLAQGKAHILAGSPGTGKTSVCVALGATVTIGGRWPDGTRADAGDVVVWSGEDDPSDTLVPRFMACGADLKRVRFIQGVEDDNGLRAFDPARDIPALEAVMGGLDVKLLIVDPIVSAVQADSHKNAEVRRSLQPLVDLAANIGCALIGVTHFTKSTKGRDPIDRVTGSLAFGALARVVLVAVKLPDGEGNHGSRLLARAKSNIGPDDGGFQYSLEQTEIDGCPGVINTRVLWGQAVDGAAKDLLATAERTDDDRTMTDDAAEFLREALSSGPIPAKEIQRQARQNGFSKSVLNRAKSTLRIKSSKAGFDGGWEWSLPEETPEDTRRYPIQPGRVSSAENNTQPIDIIEDTTKVLTTPKKGVLRETVVPSRNITKSPKIPSSGCGESSGDLGSSWDDVSQIGDTIEL